MFEVIVLLALVGFGNAIWVREMENPGLYQGDMIMRPDQLEKLNSNDSNSYGAVINYRWPGGVVPYYIDANIGRDGASAVKQAIVDYHKFTCLKFVPYSNEREYLHFHNGQGCSSPVGHNNPEFTRNGVNMVSLASGCRTKGIAMHEIGHSIGLYHEQSRPDRDSYVSILLHNIYDSNMKFNFNKLSSKINSLGFTYDYSSMMHYGSTAFGCDNYGRNCRQTIVTLDSSKQKLIGQRNGFSQGDVDQINKMYNCKGNGGTNTGDCVDKDQHCEAWAKTDECTKNPDWMKSNCKKSCAQVNGDLDKNCQQWAKTGECTANPSWMLLNCKKSCNVC